MNGIRRTFARVLVAGLLTGGVVATGISAQAWVSVRPAIGVTPLFGRPGAQIDISGMGFSCGGPVALYFQDRRDLISSYLGSADAQGARGDIQAPASVPRDAQDGPARVTAIQGGCVASATFLVCHYCLREGRREG